MPTKATTARRPRRDAAVAATPVRLPQMRGSLDRVASDGHVNGWCWSPDAPTRRREVTIALNGEPAMQLVADQPRADLASASVGDGNHAFTGRLPAEALVPGTTVLVSLTDAETGQQIGDGVTIVWPAAQPGRAAPPPPRPSAPAAPTPAPAATADLPGLSGNLDRVTRDGWVSGWCWRPDAAEQRVEVEILVGGAVVGRTLAAGFRPDLQQAGIGDGAHGFAFALPYDVLAERGTLSIAARDAASQLAIGEPVTMRLGRLAETEQRILDLERQVRLLRGQIEDRATLAHSQPAAEERAARALFARVAGFFQGLADGAADPAGAALAAALDELAATLPTLDLARPALPVALLCIPATAGAETIHRCLAALIASGADRLAEIALFDDGRADPRTALLPNVVRNLRYVRVTGGTTVPGAVDAALREHPAPLLAILDPHALAAEGWIETLIETLTRDPRAALVSAALVRGDGLLQHAGLALGQGGSLHEPGQFEDSDLPAQLVQRRIDAAAGLACLIERERAVAAGGLDHAFASLSHAVAALSLRLRADGSRLLLQPAASLRWDTASATATRPEATGPDEDARRLRLALLQALDSPGLSETAARFVGHALVVDDDIPRPDHDAGSIATFEQMLILCRLGWRVTFFPARDAAAPRGARQRLERAGIEVAQPPRTPSVAEYLREHGDGLDLVQVYRHHNMAVLLPQLRELAPRARLIFSPADLHFLREQRAGVIAGRAPDAAIEQTRAQELACLAAADASVIVSDYEMELLRGEVDPARLHLLRWIARPSARGAGFAARTGLLFIGNFNHPPNVDAVLWYAAEVAPLLAEHLPEAVLHVVGANAPAALRDLSVPGIVLHGWVEDVAPMFERVRLSVAPLRFGAGFKGKVATSLAHGVPVVGTAMAFEGTGLAPGDGIALGADAVGLANEIIRLHSDAVSWEALSLRGQERVAALYSPRAATAVYTAMLGRLGLPFTPPDPDAG